MSNVEILRQLGILDDIRGAMGVIYPPIDRFDDKINKLSPNKIMEFYSQWNLGSESWWTDMKQLYDNINEMKGNEQES